MTDQPTSTAPLAAGLPHVQGRCPACGTAGLFLGDGGYVTCSLVDCPQPDAATEVIADFWEARQHSGFTFCPQNVGHVTMTVFAKKITEKVTAVAQRGEAVRYANEQQQRAEQAEAAIDRIRARHQRAADGRCGTCLLDHWPCPEICTLDGPPCGPGCEEWHGTTPTIEATEAEKTARVFAALHCSAEQDVTRVIALYEQWVKAGWPPLGTPLSRWWDARLVELHDAILPRTDHTTEQPCTNESSPQKSPAPSLPEDTPTP